MSLGKRRRMMGMSSGKMPPAWVSNISRITVFSLEGATVSDNSTLNFGDTSVSGFSMKNITVRKPGTVVEIKCGTLTFFGSALNSQDKKTNAWTLKLSCQNNPKPTSQFTYAGSVTRIIGKEFLDTDPGTNIYRHWNNTNLIEVYFVPNKIASTCVITTGTLIDESVVSLANALKEDLATQQTITISNAATKAKLDTIIGTVSEITADDVTYHLFTQDSGGTATLRSFIENTKGWVIA